MYENAVKTHIVPAVGVIKLRDLKACRVQKTINALADKGSTRTLEIIKTTLGQILEQAIKNDYIYKNVCKDIELPKIHMPQKRALTADEKRLIETADLDIKCRAFLYFLLYTGVRRGEALALTKKDIDMKARKMYIDKSLIFKNNKPEIKPSPKSDAGFRTIPIPDVFIRVLESYLPTVTDSIYVFPSAASKVMSEAAFRRFWGKITTVLTVQQVAALNGSRVKMENALREDNRHRRRHYASPVSAHLRDYAILRRRRYQNSSIPSRPRKHTNDHGNIHAFGCRE